MSETCADNFKSLHKLPRDLFHLKCVFSYFNQGRFIEYCILNQFSLKENDHIISMYSSVYILMVESVYNLYLLSAKAGDEKSCGVFADLHLLCKYSISALMTHRTGR